MRCAILIFSLLALAATAAQADEVEFNIEAQPLASALAKYAQQADLQVLFPQATVRDLQGNKVRGKLDKERALQLLLEKTGLEASFAPNGTVLVKVPTVGSLPGEQNALDGRMKVAQSSALQQAQAATAQEGQAQQEDQTAVSASKDAEPQEIVVTGSHIRGVQDLAAPSVTFSREEIRNTGFTELDELFQSLPQNLDEISGEAQLADGISLVARSNGGSSGISLRGLGPGSTLVLLNGKRKAGNVDGRVVDISSIPLSAIERVEVVTGGRSAVYGSDAVAGVVNLVTRRDFEGAETQIQFGGARAGGERLQFSQLYGVELARGGFIAAYDYSRGRKLDLVDTGIPRPTDSGLVLDRYDIRPQNERHSGFLSGRFDLNGRVQLYADGMYTSHKHEGALFYSFDPDSSIQYSRSSSDQYSIAPGALVRLGSWSLDLSGNYSVSDTDRNSYSNSFGFEDFYASTSRSALSSVSTVAEGPVFSLAGREVRAAIGAEGRSESLKNVANGEPREDRDRTVRSAFAELFVPLSAFGRRLELSLAGRYDDYNDFGDTFNPQFGVVWGPNEQWTWRGAYAAAFRAPDLHALDTGGNVVLRNLLDPTLGPAARSVTLIASGGNPNLQSEEATTWSLGFDYKPQFAPWGWISVAYIEIDYEGRIDLPALAFADQISVLRNEQLYPGLIDRSPSSAEMADILAAATAVGNVSGMPFDRATQDVTAVFPNLVFFDNRLNNIGMEKVAAIDLTFGSEFNTDLGSLSFGLTATFSREHERKVTQAAPVFSLLNGPGKPVDLRLRFNAGWQRSAWSAFMYLNYVDSYTDTLAFTETKIDSWTTADLTLRFNTSQILSGGMFDDMDVSLGIDNVFDSDPPVFLSNSFGFGYDSVNSDAIGRYVSLRLIKRWKD
jgi:outer membrane receptor protein involved in Fe transport